MESAIGELKTRFNQISDQIGKILEIKMSAHFKISRFKTIYDEMIQMNSSKKHFLVCLEALHFQYKMFITEQESLTRLLLMLLNRVYRDYFNYYNVILKELPKYEVQAPVIAKQHLVYRDAEPSAEFQPEDIALAFDNMMSLLYSIALKYNENETVIHQYKVRSVSGIFIGNLINTLEYDNRVLDDHASLFIKSIDFTLKTQASYFSKTLKRFQCAVEDIDNEVSFQESPWDNSGMSVADQVVQKTDDGNPMVSQWTSLPTLGCPPKVGLEDDRSPPPLGCPPKVGLEGDHEPNALEKDHDLNALGCPSAVGLEKDPEPKVGLGCPSSVGLDADTKGKVENQDPDSKDPYPKALEDEVVGMTIDEIKEL
jgi:hypothetical protein